MRFASLFLSTVVLLGALGGLMLFFNAHKDPIKNSSNVQIPLAAIDNITLREFDTKSNNLAIITAEHVTVPLLQDKIPCENATVTITKEMETVGTLTITTAVIDRPNKEIACTKNIEGRIGELAFTTASGCYSFSTQHITLPEAITITGHNAITKAAHGDIDVATKKITLMGGVETTLTLSDHAAGNHRGY
jgi:hypothetical protein